jgi:anti-sigma B factor antagonist
MTPAVDVGVSPYMLPAEMSIYSAAELKTSLLAWLRDNSDAQLDASQVTYLDSAGVQVLLLIQRKANAMGRPLGLHQASPEFMSVLQTLGLVKHIGTSWTV